MRVSGKNHPSMRCYVTDDPERFQSLGSRFLGVPMDTPELVSVEQLSDALREFVQQSQRIPIGSMQLRRPVMRSVAARRASGLVA
jgi:hypothetical protein